MPRSFSGSRTEAQLRTTFENLIQGKESYDVNLQGLRQVGTDELGRPIYEVRYERSYQGFAVENPIVTRTYSYSGGRLYEPALTSGLPPDTSTGTEEPASAGDLQARKDLWLQSVYRNPLLNDQQRAQIAGLIDQYQGGLTGLNYAVKGWLDEATRTGPDSDELSLEDLFGDLLSGGSGSGRGRGSIGPIYRAPDKREVEDFVKGALVSLTGAVDDTLVADGVALYMRDHRRNFDSPSAEINPAQSVMEFIRKTPSYQEIHALRPETEDERSWISNRRQAAAAGGLNLGLQDDFAITQASIGGDLPDVKDAAAVAQVQASGSARGTPIEDKIRGAASALFRNVQ